MARSAGQGTIGRVAALPPKLESRPAPVLDDVDEPVTVLPARFTAGWAFGTARYVPFFRARITGAREVAR